MHPKQAAFLTWGTTREALYGGAAGGGKSVVKQPSGLRYFVRRDDKGGIIPNTLTISLKKPFGSVYEFKLLK